MSDPVSTGDFEETWRRRFRRFADRRDDDAGIAGWSPTGLVSRVRQFLALWKREGRQGRWLDAGCGAATYSRLLDEAGLEVVGTDYSELSLDKAAQRSPQSIMWFAGDVRTLAVRDNSFDGALCFGVTQALSDSAGVISELVRVVRPGGEIWIDGLNGNFILHRLRDAGRRLAGKPTYLRYETRRQLNAVFHDLGIRDVSVHWLPIVPAGLGVVQNWLESRGAVFLLRRLPWLGEIFSHSLILVARVDGEHEPVA